jgi:peptidoglycan/LPS O-acetylase OafA/YrhL
MLPSICSKVKNVNSALLLFLTTLTLALIVDPYIRENTVYPYFHEYNFFVQLPVFPLGIMAYFFLNREQHEIKPLTWAYLAAMILVFCYVAVPKHIMFSLAFVLLLILQAKYNFRLFSNRFLSEVGKVSFSMYLLHFAVVYLFNRSGFCRIVEVTDFGSSVLNFVLMYIVVAGVAFAVSAVTYRAIEVPGQNLGRKLIKRLSVQSKARTKQ